jgi:hypothetical protein
MAVNYIAALQTTRMTAVINAIDAGTAGTLEIATTGYGSVLATVPLAKPSFSVGGSPPNCAITLLSTPRSVNAGASGTAAVARIKDSSLNVIVNNLTVGTSAADIILNSVSITSGQSVSITAGTITHSA